MTYFQTTYSGALCPKCQRRLTLVFEDEGSTSGLAICHKCRRITNLANEELPKKPASKLIDPALTAAKDFARNLPAAHTYKGPGSQLRLMADQTFQRSWLSLREYEQQFGETLAYDHIDLRTQIGTCKWCGKTLPKGRRSFCKDSCSRNYSKVTFTKRTTPTVPYRIACRDNFTCQATGADLAQYTRFGQRIPASNGQLVIHHLIPVAQQGTDHEQNLLTLASSAHIAYHADNPELVAKIDAIKEARFQKYHKVMVYQ